MWTQFYTQLPTFKPHNLFLATVLKKKKRKNTLFLPTSYLSPTSSYIECPLTINHIYLPNPFTLQRPIILDRSTTSYFFNPSSPPPQFQIREIQISESKDKKKKCKNKIEQKKEKWRVKIAKNEGGRKKEEEGGIIRLGGEERRRDVYNSFFL